MKRIVTLVAAAALLLGLAATASAELAVKAAGTWRVHGNVLNNFGDFNDDEASTFGDTFTVQHRARTQFRFVYNENVMAELYTEYGNATWGQGPAEYAAKGPLNVKRAFVQFRWPDTDVLITAGEQDITFPSSGAFSNMVQGGDDGAAVAVSTPITDMIGLTVAYARLAEVASTSTTTLTNDPVSNVVTSDTTTENVTAGNDFDVFLAALPVTLDGMKFAPWFSYAIVGQNSGFNTDTDTANVWWAGLGFNMDMLDPIVIYADFMYGSADKGYALGNDSNGWLLDAMVEFKGLDFAVLQAFGAYSSQNDDGDGAMPYIDSDFTIGGSMINGSSFTTDLGPATPGFWLAGAAARNITFIEKLSHDLIFLYAKGTNSDRTGFGSRVNKINNLPLLTSDDSYIEADFNTRYQIYESLAAIVELGYGKPSFDDDTPDDATMKAAFGFLYKF